MEFNIYKDLYLHALEATFGEIDCSSVELLVKQLLNHERIFLLGRGRSGFVIDTFAMRLTHLGLQAYCISKPTTPVTKAGDMVMLSSGSGETGSILLAAEKAKKIGAYIVAVSMRADSSLCRLADHVVILPQSESLYDGRPVSKVLFGTLFSQANLLLFDIVVGMIIEETGQTFGDLSARHANIE